MALRYLQASCVMKLLTYILVIRSLHGCYTYTDCSLTDFDVFILQLAYDGFYHALGIIETLVSMQLYFLV